MPKQLVTAARVGGLTACIPHPSLSGPDCCPLCLLPFAQLAAVPVALCPTGCRVYCLRVTWRISVLPFSWRTAL